MYIPDKLRATAVNRWGSDGQVWLDSLPSLIAKYEDLFSIRVGAPFEDAYCNFVADALTEGGDPVVLKLGFPRSEIHTELEALAAFNGRGSVSILDVRPDKCAVLLKRVQPGYDLTTVENDEEATGIAAQVMRDLPCEVPTGCSLPTFMEWLEVMERIGDDHPLPHDLLNAAKELAKQLDSTAETKKLLHGDLHHNNILFDQSDGWISIDPQGVIGDPVCEVGHYFHNPHGIEDAPDLKKILQKRAETFAEILEADVARVLGWGFVMCVVSCCWSVEDNEDGWQATMKCARVLESLCGR